MKYFLTILLLLFISVAQNSLSAEDALSTVPEELYKSALLCMKDDSADRKKVLELFLKAEKEGYREKDVYLIIGRIYAGEGDQERAFRWNEKAALKGSTEGALRIAMAYCYGEGIEQDYEKALKCFLKAAEKGDVRAEEHVGICYLMGLGISRDSEEAFKWFLKAAAKGHSPAQMRVGEYYLYNEGKKDFAKAEEWLLKAAEQKNPEAMNLLGEAYMEGGPGIGKNQRLAFEWYSKAAELNNPEALKNLSDCYYYGKGTEKNSNEALKFYERAAEYGYTDAQFKALILSLEKKDLDKAVKYARMLENSEYAKEYEIAIADSVICVDDISKGNIKGLFHLFKKYAQEILIILFIILSIIAFCAGGMIFLLLILYFISSRKTISPGPLKTRDAFSAFIIMFLSHLVFGFVFGIAGIFVAGKLSREPELYFFLSVLLAAVAANIFNALLWFLIIKLRKYGIKETFHFSNMPFRKWIYWVAGGMIFFLGFDYGYERLLKFFGKTIPPQELVSRIQQIPLDSVHVPHIIFVIFTIGILIPVFEEIIFRGVIYQAMRNGMANWIAAVFSSALFAVIHMEAAYFVPLFVFGMILAYAYRKSNSITLPIAIHCINNTCFIMAIFAEKIL